MATTYAMPPTPGCGGHGHSHSTESAPQRDPLHSPTLNGAYQFNTMPIHLNSFNPSDNLRKGPPKMAEAFPDLQPHQSQPSTLQLPKPPSFSSPNNARRKSMERRKSAGLPTHLNLTGNEYGFPKVRIHKFQENGVESVRSWVSISEIVCAVLILLPYALMSLVFGIGIRPRAFEHSLLSSAMEPPATDGNIRATSLIAGTSMPLVCGLTAITLFLLGLRGKLAQWRGTMKSSESLISIGQLKRANLRQSGRKVARRVVTVGLPFFAVSQLGPARVSAILVTALASKVMVIEERTMEIRTWQWWKGLAAHRMWTVLSFFSQVILDLSGVTNGMPIATICLGYLALGLMIFISPPPYPSLARKSSVPSSRNNSTDTSSKRRTSFTMLSISPLISTPEDIDLTLSTALLLSIFVYCLSFIKIPSAGAISHYQIAWSVLTGLSAVVALLFTNIQVLERSRTFGSSLGSISLLLFITIVHDDTWLSFAYQSLLISISFIALATDTRMKSPPKSQSTNHHQHHSPHRHGSLQVREVAGASRFTNHVLRWVQNRPLLHTILVEKDSRRIFYFMW